MSQNFIPAPHPQCDMCEFGEHPLGIQCQKAQCLIANKLACEKSKHVESHQAGFRTGSLLFQSQ